MRRYNSVRRSVYPVDSGSGPRSPPTTGSRSTTPRTYSFRPFRFSADEGKMLDLSTSSFPANANANASIARMKLGGGVARTPGLLDIRFAILRQTGRVVPHGQEHLPVPANATHTCDKRPATRATLHSRSHYLYRASFACDATSPSPFVIPVSGNAAGRSGESRGCHWY
ncbi:hypothetical protein C8F01DRAFT_717226 [Mycena amicta]|nr:hypothetical protein C8F01DRAFT_717226 [Mycena amicta]